MKMRIRHGYIISVTLIFLWFIPPLQAVERIALVIGNGAYEIKPLDNPPHDAEDVAKMLRQVGFQAPIVKIDADQATMESAIAAFGERLHKGAVGLFYYAGHAVQYGGENYLIPIGAMNNGLMDSPEQLKYKAVNASYVLEVMESAGNDLNIIILDACRDNPFKSKYATRGLNSPRGGLAEMPKANGSVIAYATAPGETAKDGSGRNSPYTKQFLQWMQKPNLPIELMLKEVGKGVKRETQEEQRPWYESSIDGDFYFVERSTSTTPSTPVVTVSPSIQVPPQQVAMIPPPPSPPVAMTSPQQTQLAPPTVAGAMDEAVQTLSSSQLEQLVKQAQQRVDVAEQALKEAQIELQQVQDKRTGDRPNRRLEEVNQRVYEAEDEAQLAVEEAIKVETLRGVHYSNPLHYRGKIAK